MANKLIARMCLMYGPPNVEDPEAWFAEMDRLVKAKLYTEEELDCAADIVLRTNRRLGFPAVSVLLTAMEDARQQLHPVKIQTSKDEYPEWTKERIEQADRLIKCSMGRKAAEEGWIFSLHSFCRERQRLPENQYEISYCKRIAREFDEKHQQCREGQGGTLGPALERLGDSMLERRAELARIALGGNA
jgi:hypothetical protein